MKDIDNAFLEQMKTDRFQDIMSDDLSFADSLIDEKDIQRVFNKEDEINGND